MSLESVVEELEENIEYKRHVIEILADAVSVGIKALPDSESFKYCWDEMTDSEQQEVKRARIKLNRALEIYERWKKNEK